MFLQCLCMPIGCHKNLGDTHQDKITLIKCIKGTWGYSKFVECFETHTTFFFPHSTYFCDLFRVYTCMEFIYFLHSNKLIFYSIFIQTFWGFMINYFKTMPMKTMTKQDLQSKQKINYKPLPAINVTCKE